MQDGDLDLVVGLDVGSTTVKAVVVDGAGRLLFSDYQRHHTHQPEKVLEMATAIQERFGHAARDGMRAFVTGSGGGPLAEPLHARFVQEVNAVAMAVERLHPDVASVVELGGQDAKVIRFSVDPGSGQRTVTTSMNDKCASGTGATIDKCLLKVGAEPGFAEALRFDATRLHHVAAKCGVFAETDIVNLVKSGIPKDEILCSLADAIVMQNLSVLARGSTLRPRVALLGGPNTYLPFLRDCWRLRIPETWRERGLTIPERPVDELVFVPPNAALYAALGAALLGMASDGAGDAPRLRSLDGLRDFIGHGRRARLGEQAGPPLVGDASEAAAFAERYRVPAFEPPRLEPGRPVSGVIGLDGGSTSSKAVLIDLDGALLAKAYRLSEGNPLDDAKALLAELRGAVEAQGATLECVGFGATGYAAGILEQTLLADVAVVETVAHVVSALHCCGEVDVVCDIGGQDIKVLFLRDGEIDDFRLSNSCSAGNGMLLQAMADQFGISVRDYAVHAFRAELAPRFSYGCAVFLDSDRVTFQKEGYQREELLAGLAQVLPKNVWQYVAQVPRLAALGRRFVLQGGTQYNLAAVKAQVDYIEARVPGAEVRVHPHAGEAGALGVALETLRRFRRTGTTRFVGIDAAIALESETRNDESTVCHFCPNECRRTFVDARRPDGSTARFITGFSCEKGTVESEAAMLEIAAEQKRTAAAFPNLVDYEGRRAFQHAYDPAPLPPAGTPVEDVEVVRGLFRLRRRSITRPFRRSSEDAAARRARLRIGIPRVLNLYSTAPFFRAYLEALGIQRRNVVFSDETSEDLWLRGGRYGSVDPCFPSKVAQAHIHSLLFEQHQPERKRPLAYVFFPMLTHVPSFVVDTMDDACCPIVAGTPAVMKAAFTKEVDLFAQRGIEFVSPALTFTEPTLLARRLFEAFGERLGVTEDESDHAVREGWRALAAFEADLQAKGRAILETVEREDRLAILLLGRPYHADPGLNHGIPELLQALGYPILSVRSIPKDRAFLERFYREDLEGGTVKDPLELNHVWPENYSANSAQKVWAATFAARHPNVAVLDLSSFKCGHDAPTYALVSEILHAGHTSTAALHDLDANKPGGSIQIRVQTFAHSLRLAEERLQDLAARRAELERRVAEKRAELERLRDAARWAARSSAARAVPGASPAGTAAPDATGIAPPPTLLRLGRKTPEGGVVRLPLGGHRTASAAE